MTSIGRAARVVAAVLLAGCGSEARLQRIELSPEVVQVTEHLQAQVTATAVWDDGARRDVTAEAAWSSQDPTLASVEAGLVQAGPPAGTYLVAAAGTNLAAAWGGLQASARVDVRPATLRSLEVTVDGVALESATLAAGLDARLVVLGTYSDDSVRDVTGLVTWSDDHDGDVDDPAQIDLDGWLHAEAEDTLTLWATLDGQVHPLTVQITAAEPVSIALAGLEAPVPAGLQAQLRVYALLTDGHTADVTSGADLLVVDPSVATLGLDGVLRVLREGTTEVQAAYRGLATSATLHGAAAVVQAIEIVPRPDDDGEVEYEAQSLVFFQGYALKSDGSRAPVTAELDWHCSDPRVAYPMGGVGAGNMFLKYPGAVTIHALHASGVEGLLDIVIEPRD